MLLHMYVPFGILLTGLLALVDGSPFTSCHNVHGKDLSQLHGIWEVHYNNSGSQEVYLINICDTLMHSQCINSSVCLTKDGSSGVSTSYGDVNEHPQIMASSDSAVSFYMEYNTSRHCQTTLSGSYFYRSSITFECSMTLGSPLVISSDNCSVDFLWETSLACRSAEYDATQEVRCYAYDDDGHKRDLSSLIKRVGGYLIADPSSTSSDKVYINVCRDIKTVSGDEMNGIIGSCPSGSAACLIKDEHYYALGRPQMSVNITAENRLVLSYKSDPSDAKPPECSTFTPQVTVTFVCPGNTRGGSKQPILTSSLNCQYTIEWWTETACPLEFITHSQCGLDIARHGISLDLSPLTKADHYKITTNDKDQTEFYLNVCDATGTRCGKNPQNRNAVCQTTSSNQKGFIAGQPDDYLVQYVDGQLSITYKNGDRCNGNGFRRTSVILFHCNATAGLGTPTFNHELHCTYYFDWQSSQACVDQPVCHVTDDSGHSFDLSPLTKIPGDENWEVLVGSASNHQTTQPRYFVNVCGEVLKDRVTSACPPGSAICLIQNQKAVSFGSVNHFKVTRQDNKLMMTYSGGDKCGTSKFKSTFITFYCRPGDLEGSPFKKYLSADGCQLHLSWYTAAACPLKTVHGSNCVVSDEESGLTFDLRRLQSTTDGMYSVTTSQYKYYVNVCGPLVGTPCNVGSNNPASCQVESVGEARYFTLGKPSEELTYYNGFIKLLYKDGDPYRNHLHNRSAQISFLCDTKAGAGHPQFVSEGNFTYLFDWYTSYVCPAASVQCMVTDPKTGAQYDLSSLAKSEDDEDANWSVMGDDMPHQGKRKYYLNVCRPVNEVQDSGEAGCDALAAACETIVTPNGKESISVANLGRPASAPQVESTDHLLLTYNHGMRCVENKVASNFSTKIHFSCQRGVLASSPRFLSRTNCSVSFLWDTEAACSMKESTGIKDNLECEVVDSNSAYTFNLQPLLKKPDQPYVVTVGGSHYELNVCGTVSGCTDASNTNIAGCKIDSSRSISQRVLNHSAPQHSNDGALTISYQSPSRNEDGQFLSYIIHFICNRTIAKGKPEFAAIDGNAVRFDFPTSLACEPEPLDCLVTDDVGNQYDLSPLSTHEHPWTVVDSTKQRNYYISVCRPLPPVEGCSGSGSGACFTERNQAGSVTGHSLGLVQSNPQAVSDRGQGSAVSITYVGGDRCDSDPKRRYSTRILFECSEQEGSSPVLQLDDTDQCEFLFVWQTPAACPVKKTVGHDCSVTDPLYQMTFDLSSLAQAKDYKVTTNGEWDFNVNICSKLKGATGACQGSGSCQVHKSLPASATQEVQMHDAGKPNTTLMYKDGIITLTYLHGEPCHQRQFERSTTFRFSCDHEDNMDSSNGKPTFINETADCTYLFDWPTAKVCPPIKIVGCTAQHHLGEQYDLSSLSLSSDNYHAATRGDTGGRAYFINVCRTLLHKPGETCPPNSAACVKNGSKYINLGEVSSGPQFNGDTLQMVYTNGDVCVNDKSRKYTTVITFRCDPNSAVHSLPVVVTTEESCTVQMLWLTKAACAIGSTGSTKPAQNSPCTVTNPATRHMFNLSTLASPTYYDVSGVRGRYFHINICNKIVDTNCSDNTGNCMLTYGGSPDPESAGAISSDLRYYHGALSLTYENGAACEANRAYKHSTVISFVCHRSEAPHLQIPTTPVLLPIYVGDDKETCRHYFSWHTHAACEIVTPCAAVKPGSYVPVDFSQLIPESGHYLAVSDQSGKNAVYFINVCRPLEPIEGVLCPPGSTVCEAVKGRKSKSLGYIDPMKNMVLYNRESGSFEMTYESGEQCASNPAVNVSTRIVFSCVPRSEKGLPVLTTITSDCVYVFEWGTEVVCGPDHSISQTPNDCTYTDHDTGVTYDLTKLSELKLNMPSGTYYVSMCGSLKSKGSQCASASVCFVDNSGTAASLGTTSSRKLTSGATAKVPMQAGFQNGDQCPDGSRKRQTSILFLCDRGQNKQSTIIEDSERCHYIIYWSTPYACPPPSKSCVASSLISGLTYDLSLLSSLTHSWSFRDKNDNLYFLNLCRPVVTSSRSPCGEDATACRKDSNSKIQNLGMLSSQIIQIKSKDVVLVKYTGGDTGLCSNPELSASTEITLTCSKAVTSKPVLDMISQSDCVFHISWQSRIACANQVEQVSVDDSGKLVDPKTGATIDLSPLYNKQWTARGDMRQEASGPAVYEYLISLRGNLAPSDKLGSQITKKCSGDTAVCQYKGVSFARQVGAWTPAPSYVMTDESLEITFNSTDECGKAPSKLSHSVITLRCSQYSDIGNPTFVYESNECGYFFQWYTNVICTQAYVDSLDAATLPSASLPLNVSQQSVHEVSDRHSRAVSTVIIIFTVVAVICVLVVAFHRPERRKSFAMSVKRLCGFGPPGAKYRYIPSGFDGDEGTSLFDEDMLATEQETSLLRAPRRGHGAINNGESGHTQSSMGGSTNEVKTEDIFEIPSVEVKSSSKRTKPKKGKGPAKKASANPNPFEDSDSDDLLPFLKESKKSKAGGQKRVTGVGGKSKVASYHDDDDEDLLEG